ncbi:MAG: AmmeMemoRadiSam system protein B [Candidatus Kerfeldbacteria bacterium RIFCSPLOWO2_01_FULL_48_11]|uniref:AmmeMemoRadiSam system protein B n=1 Tax=Candidatus Kerfeldbacteria bacterium RIFCSPLOWO2_01_FULL_48_11 TaxID=1798543 RepID=A0A1G2B0X4_9BACT|nr:MAG: Extradiol ring-cleavage dioxygenase class III protein subunit B [Parcubacteria group bacterium GW2011_GWA2_48_9]KKW16608.1 MAG: Extradiol ring-cleavage dioxygenase class III protein subunit B [Parcubacteria group bacterium GW2011_GWC2_49_9]OGY82814.1 MAG: AmmeMemoRadiSam system protein B [Candidatus Kerfeldbacteria bacterium RIFCSPLOWO2_01_FULL_48_11]HCJ52459.1 hypothetical protein [Candidatus Kerfeldbacteria bacterium]
MLVFAAITPHPPIVIPTIGKDNMKFVTKTVNAYRELGEDMYAARPDTIIVISPHGPMLQNAFAINLMPRFGANFEEFGDLVTWFTIPGDVGFTHQLKEHIETRYPVVLMSQEKLDHGVGVPLYFLTQNLNRNNVKLIPMSFSLLDYESHFEFGRALQEEIINDNRRIAVVASGDLSHKLTEHSPAGYNPKAKEFDEHLIQLIKKNDVAGILHLNRELVEEAAECGLRSIIILLGILNSMRVKPNIMSYEAPFGVGYLTASFTLGN